MQQEQCAHYLAQFTECPVQLVFTAVSAEPAQDRRGGDLAEFDRDGDSQHVLEVGFDQRPVVYARGMKARASQGHLEQMYSAQVRPA
ncbi:hypothetical protein XOCgx_2370 [Xanthomonas oryzae pv. oryzicola]|nr:hypothetical protein XOCgx_2370 [Xanthomonas oryzae pv. oryzicola]